MNPDAKEHLPAVREALAADSLVRRLQSKFSESYAPLGTVQLEMDHYGDATDYECTLDLGSATAAVSYQVDETQYERQTFVSNPDRVMVVRLRADQAGQLGFRVRFESLLRYRVFTDDEIIYALGLAGASFATLLVSVSTCFNGFDREPGLTDSMKSESPPSNSSNR